ncbi:D-alanyl-D-alanine carboxypeptidase [Eubacteriaceae bacterium CHKCI005]|nr:D-alanyl-D-alanine carboxypeptidase [Eubacteriaceae bacterium CHKCI005]
MPQQVNRSYSRRRKKSRLPYFAIVLILALLVITVAIVFMTQCSRSEPEETSSSQTSSSAAADSSSSSSMASSSAASSSSATESSQAPSSSASEAPSSTSPSSSSKPSSGTITSSPTSAVDGVVPTGAGTGLGYKSSDWRLRIPNIDSPIEDDEIPELSTIESGGSGKFYLDSRAADDFDAMMAAAKKDGMNLYVSSSYRTPAYQKNLFEKRVKAAMANGESRAEAENTVAKETARPGTSDHMLGLAVDFNGVKNAFKDTKEYDWLIEHCAEYGFILRYPEDKVDITKVSYEPWHYRYVGKEHAAVIMEKKICLEEYVQDLG